MSKDQFSHMHVVLYVSIFVALAIFTLWVSQSSSVDDVVIEETVQERLYRESRPGEPVFISDADKKRIAEESRPRIIR